MANLATARKPAEKVWLASNDNALIEVGTPSRHLRRATQSQRKAQRAQKGLSLLK